MLLGVVGGVPGSPRLQYLAEPVMVTPELLALAEPVDPEEVFRFAAPCALDRCQHFADRCTLIERLVQQVEIPDAAGPGRLPRCHLRPKCRWWQEEREAACACCPMVVRQPAAPSDELAMAAAPPAAGPPPMVPS